MSNYSARPAVRWNYVLSHIFNVMRCHDDCEREDELRAIV